MRGGMRCAAHLAVDGLGVRQLAHSVAQGVALVHVDGVQLAVAQLAQARALQVGLAQAGRRAVAHHVPQRLPDLVHLHSHGRFDCIAFCLKHTTWQSCMRLNSVFPFGSAGLSRTSWRTVPIHAELYTYCPALLLATLTKCQSIDATKRSLQELLVDAGARSY